MKTKNALIVVGLVGALLVSVSGCSDGPFAPWRPGTLTEMDEYIEGEMAGSGIPGLAIVVTVDEQVVWSAAFGWADVETRRPMTTDTPMRVGSISKTAVALTVMRLVERGDLTLDDRVDELLPGVVFDDPNGEMVPVRVQHLLNHSAGLRDDDLPELASVYPEECELSPLDILAGRRYPLHSTPGQTFSYSNVGYGLLGAIIEQVTGERFESVVQTQILDPLAMVHSSFRLTSALQGELAVGYTGTDSGLEAEPYYCYSLRPAGTLHASAGDLARLVMMLANEGTLGGRRILSAETVGAMRDTQVDGYGLGIRAYDLAGGYRVFGHAGGSEGFNSLAWFDPGSRTGVVSVVNCYGVDCINANLRVLEAAFRVALSASVTQ